MLAYQNVKRNKGSVCTKEKEILEVQRNIFENKQKKKCIQNFIGQNYQWCLYNTKQGVLGNDKIRICLKTKLGTIFPEGVC